MSNENKLSILNEDLDDESAKFIKEAIDSWKEGVMEQLNEEVERAKEAKLEELERENLAYREELKAEYSDKLTNALYEAEDSIRADVTANVLKENPELKILESIKELVAPLLNEEYRNDAYSNTIAQLAEENESLRREQEILEGAQTLASLIAPYSKKTQKLVLSLIKEGSPEEVTEQFYELMESLEDVFAEDEKAKDEDDDAEDEDDDAEDDDAEDDDEEEDDEEDDDDEDVDEDYYSDESYINEGFDGDDDTLEEGYDYSRLSDVIRSYVKK